MDEDELEQEQPLLREGALDALNNSSLSGSNLPEQEERGTELLPEAMEVLEDLGSEQPQEDRQEEAARGEPHPDYNEIVNQWRQAGQARVRQLERLFGTDALVLGHLVFKVPPLAIRVKKGNIVYRWKPLRTKESIAVKSGNGECFIEVDLAFVGKEQIRDFLGELVALWKKMPFCPIENVHIRRMMLPGRQEGGQSMYVCLETLVMDAIAGKPNSVFVTLILRWFNYKPFSHNLMLRKDWRGADEVEAIPEREDRGNVIIEDEEGDIPAVNPDSTEGTSIVDLSAIDAPETLELAQPPEARLNVASQDPSDPDIAPTYPVAYGFNSRPFMQRVTSGPDAARRIPTWNDALRLKWRSFIRTRVPVSWQYNFENQQTRVSPPTTRDRGAEAQPAAVTGDRDIILFIGDSILHGFTGKGSSIGTTGDLPIHRWTTGFMDASQFDGFEVYVVARDGMATADVTREGGGVSKGFVSTWNYLKTNAQFRRSENFDRVAGVVIHIGTNDGPRTQAHIDRLVGRVENVASEINEFGAVPVICSLPPLGDSDSRESDLADAVQAQLDAINRAYQQMAGRVNGTFLNYHPSCAEGDGSTFNVPYLSQFQADGAPLSRGGPRNPNKINLHPNHSGNTAIGTYVSRNLPWSSMRGQETSNERTQGEIWNVCEVEDGDTIWVCKDGDLRCVRMKNIDTLETYGDHSDAPTLGYTASQLDRWLPEGQDSWRGAKYGDMAKTHLESLVGGGENPTVQIREFEGLGAHGRHLAVIWKGDRNINVEMVRAGYAYYTGDDDQTGTEYIQARDQAIQGHLGIHGNFYVPLSGAPEDLPDSIRNHLESGMEPVNWRSSFPPDSVGGHSGQPSGDECSGCTSSQEVALLSEDPVPTDGSEFEEIMV